KPKDPLDTLLETQRYYDALRLVEQRLEKNPKNWSLRLLKGQVLRMQGNFDDAYREYLSVQRSTNHKPTQALALNGMGWTHYAHARHLEEMGECEKSKQLMEEAKAAFDRA